MNFTVIRFYALLTCRLIGFIYYYLTLFFTVATCTFVVQGNENYCLIIRKTTEYAINIEYDDSRLHKNALYNH